MIATVLAKVTPETIFLFGPYMLTSSTVEKLVPGIKTVCALTKRSGASITALKGLFGGPGGKFKRTTN